MWLIEWLKNTWQEIVAGVSISTLIAVIVMIVKNVISGKAINKLTNNLSNLTSNLSKIAGTKDTIDENTKSNSTLLERVNALEIALNANNKALEAMLSIMGIVYMRAKDEDVRSSVSSILSTFKTGDITIRNLKLELEEVKKQLAEALTTKDEKDEQVEQVEQENEVENKEILMRG